MASELPSSVDFSDEGEADNAKDFQVKSSRWLRMVNWYHVISIYFPTIFIGLSFLVITQFGTDMVQAFQTGRMSYSTVVETVNSVWAIPLVWRLMALVTLGAVLLVSRNNKPLYILDFAVWEPPQSWRVSKKGLVTMFHHQGVYTKESVAFMERVLENSGTGESTALPPGLVRGIPGSAFHPPGDEPTHIDASIGAARQEAETVIFEIVQDVLARTGTHPRQIDVLVVNCSLFSPTPSLCALRGIFISLFCLIFGTIADYHC